MNICMTASNFPPDMGGPATYIPAIATELTRRGHQVIVVALSDTLTNDDSIFPFRVIRVKRSTFRPLRMLIIVWTLLRLGRRAHIFFDNSLPWETIIARLLLGGKPMIQKVVGDGAWEKSVRLKWTEDSFDAFQHEHQSLRVRILKRWFLFLRSRADVILVPSHYLARCAEGWGVHPQNIKVIFNAIRSIETVPPIARPLNTAFTLVTVSRLVPWKHVDGILRAVARSKDIGLIVVGDGTERTPLEAVSRSLGIEERVYFAGHRSPHDVHGLMTQSDAFVLNSSYEGLPHIVLEAMQLNVPVIATAAGGTPEVVHDGETGLLVPIGDDEALVNAIQRVRDDAELRAQLVQTADTFVDTHFSFDAMVVQTEALISSLATRSK